MIKKNKCPVCEHQWSREGGNTTKLRGIYSLETNEVIEWMCPKCKTRWSKETGEVTKQGKVD